MTTHKIGMGQGDWDEAKKLLAPPREISLSLDEGSTKGSKKEEVDTLDVAIPVRLDIHHVDVGQGESTLLTVMAGESTCIASVLIDAGLELEGGGMLVRLLHRLGIGALDAVIVSHFDEDHCAGLIRVLKHYQAFDEETHKPLYDVDEGETWQPIMAQKILLRCMPTQAKKTKATKLIEEILADYNEGVVALVEEGDEIILDCDADKGLFKMTCVSVNAGDSNSKDYENTASIGWVVELGKHTYYTAGDLPSVNGNDPIEDGIGAEIFDKWGPLTAMKCGHHGAETSTSPTFLAAVQPSLAFISAGKQDGFLHPRTKTLVSLFGQETVKGVLMTNCMYNRPWVHEDYLATAFGEVKDFVSGAMAELDKALLFVPRVPNGAEASKSGDATALQAVIGLRDGLGKRKRTLATHRLSLEDTSADDVTAELLQKIRGEATSLDELLSTTSKVLNKAISSLRQGFKVSSDEGQKELKRDIDRKLHLLPALELVKAAATLGEELLSARTAQAKKRASPLLVLVAGSAEHMGNIVLRFHVDDAQSDTRACFVGLHVNAAWTWLPLYRGKIEDQIIALPTDSFLHTVHVEKIANLLVPGSPSREVDDSDEEEGKKKKKKPIPKSWKESSVDRKRKREGVIQLEYPKDKLKRPMYTHEDDEGEIVIPNEDELVVLNEDEIVVHDESSKDVMVVETNLKDGDSN